MRKDRKFLLNFELKGSEKQKLHDLLQKRIQGWKGKKPCSRELLQEFELSIRQILWEERMTKAEEKSRLEDEERQFQLNRFTDEILNGIHSFWIVDEFPILYTEALKHTEEKILKEECDSWWKLYIVWQKGFDISVHVEQYKKCLSQLSRLVKFHQEIQLDWGIYKSYGDWDRDFYIPVSKLLEEYYKNLNEIIS